MRRSVADRPWSALAALALPAGLVAASCGGPGDSLESLAREIAVCPGPATLEGIDVSKHNGVVDWAQVKASGRAFAFARVSDGLDYPDETFEVNYAGIKSAGMVRGSYQFFRPAQDPVAQADHLLSRLPPLEQGDLPPALDIEETPGDALPAPAVFREKVQAWMDRVQGALGRAPLVYTRRSFWDAYLSSGAWASNGLWAANWDVACPFISERWSDWLFWQYADDGTVAGISKETDLDRFNGTLEDLERLTGPSLDGGMLRKDGGSGQILKKDANDFGGDLDAGAPVEAGDSPGCGGCSGARVGPALESALALALLGSCRSLRRRARSGGR
jgi:lysozyme